MSFGENGFTDVDYQFKSVSTIEKIKMAFAYDENTNLAKLEVYGDFENNQSHSLFKDLILENRALAEGLDFGSGLFKIIGKHVASETCGWIEVGTDWINYHNEGRGVVSSTILTGSRAVFTNASALGFGTSAAIGAVVFCGAGVVVASSAFVIAYYAGDKVGEFIHDTSMGGLEFLFNDIDTLESYIFGKTGTVSLSSTLLSARDSLASILEMLRKDPLVLDLDGDGIDLTSVENSNVIFDMEGDGTAEKTGWIDGTSDDAFLVADKNNNGNVDDVDELFGNDSETGFEELSKYDSNKDGIIDSNDSQFNKLLRVA